MNHSSILLLDDSARDELWERVVAIVEDYANLVDTARVAPRLDPNEIRSLIKPFGFEQPVAPMDVVDFVTQGLWQHQTHTPHPRYFGLFNPAPTTMSVVADALVAAFNPQLAAWGHSPFAVEIEQHLVRAFGSRFGYDPSHTDGTFTSGGSEANHTALLTALVHAFPRFAQEGLRGLTSQPVFYISDQSHHSVIKAARFCGLGSNAARMLPTNENFQMDVEALLTQINKDRDAGLAPVMIVATGGTTNAGIVDPIDAIATIAAAEDLWMHVDAAWGGAAALVPELCPLLHGIERADSITFDAHKWLSIPMAAGLYLTRHMDILERTCRITAEYIPRDADQLDVIEPYKHSMQTSRRFIGLKIFLSLAVAGWTGYAEVIRHQVAMGDLLRRELSLSQWQIVNETELPVVCFVDNQDPRGKSALYLEEIARQVVSSGRAWISTTRLDQSTPVLRACITNYRTTPEDISALVQVLDKARRGMDQ
jgi:glutamate/tyrosine decarboxylase-like PLP-dependent enzyme